MQVRRLGPKAVLLLVCNLVTWDYVELGKCRFDTESTFSHGLGTSGPGLRRPSSEKATRHGCPVFEFLHAGPRTLHTLLLISIAEFLVTAWVTATTLEVQVSGHRLQAISSTQQASETLHTTRA